MDRRDDESSIYPSGRRELSEVKERVARVEENQEHQSELLEGIDGKLDNMQDKMVTEGEFSEIDDRTEKLWQSRKTRKKVIQVAKWGTGIASGGGVLALVVSTLL